MRIRSYLPLSAAVLLAACLNSPPHDGAVTPDATIPICRSTPPPAGVTQVMVQVAANGDANPTLCTIFSGTDVVWEKRGTTPFMLKFKQSPGEPSAGWAPGEPGRFLVVDTSRQFPSSGSGAEQEVKLHIKTVTVIETIDYCVATTVDCVDPGIKILPR